jgi:hypothetical protein
MIDNAVVVTIAQIVWRIVKLLIIGSSFEQ